MQGESFRPNEIEHLVDKTILDFLNSLQNMEEDEFNKAKESVLFELNEWSQNLPQVADKFYVNMDEQILEESDQTYVEIAQTMTQKSLYLFAKEFLINKPRRLTIELFAKQISEQERAFRLESENTLDRRPYEVVSLESLIERKKKANQQFKKL